jgi:small subunit ribosomal protein S9
MIAKKSNETPFEIPSGVKYIESVGRRKTSVARVRMAPHDTQIISINEKPLEKYFPTADLQRIPGEPFAKLKLNQKFAVTAHLNGGGINSQAEALRHAIARALLAYDPTDRKKLKKAGYLKRDPRMKERRKFGLKKARKAPQWSKR